MPIPADALDGRIIPFPDQASYYGLFGFTILAFIALGLNLLVLLANRGQVATPNSLLILSLCFSDFILSLTIIVISTGNLVHQGYFWGKFVCLIDCFVRLGCCSIASITLATIATERYFAVCRGIPTLFKRVKIGIAVVWAFVVGCSLILFSSSEASRLIVLLILAGIVFLISDLKYLLLLN